MKRSQLQKQMLIVLLKRRHALRRLVDSELTELAFNDFVGDACDEAQENTDRAFYAQLAQTESTELAAIEGALKRIKEGSYGKCVDCGRNIPVARLRAIPHTANCIECQRAAENRQSKGRFASHWGVMNDFDPNDDGPTLEEVESAMR
ncbi:MAG: TraR/DksA family transcriptional regulator [Pirellulaceae bacterium]